MSQQRPPMQWGAVRNGRRHECPYCKVILLTGEIPGFCCGTRGSRLQDVPPLPPLPDEFNIFLNHPQISKVSRALNLIFSFASLETTHDFPSYSGSAMFAIQGKIIHK
ncbi:hypothetical protein CC1G_02421 [Coprinopsis cinerea okayama7|uniref:Uncharacterized protein n=1 Tax=Coprinopsis cinerea (strain Okayama-7 / 130 / ATCC MYA-4618 / FGSC 9003) TaxID=240176 RepID=A8NBG1_COPC7|nr:hypothetical protein CC1G_02421 [Coprinopsis cinerea okayama7\|eukprot:XP_001832159.2 hypothetical protein CC1G_02421 [Coprinopsis cinerea okayama7\